MDQPTETTRKGDDFVYLRHRVAVDADRSCESWFGGNPRLPSDVDWPHNDGELMRFVAQINLAELPSDLWGGIGPRSGWISVFLPFNSVKAATVLFTEQRGDLRIGPRQGDAYWFWPSNYSRIYETTNRFSPQWPIEFIRHSEKARFPLSKKKYAAIGYPDPYEELSFDLTKEEFQPVNTASTASLFKFIEQDLQLSLDHIVQYKQSDGIINVEDLSDFEARIAEVLRNIHWLRDDLLSNICCGFSHAAVSATMRCLSKIVLLKVQLKQVGPLGTGHSRTELIEAAGNLLFPRGVGRTRLEYSRILYEHAKHAYADNFMQLSVIQRLWWHKIFSADANYECGVMGCLYPMGYISLPYGPGSGFEVLLDLPTSKLSGWIWGDMYRLVLMIATEDLRAGRFENIKPAITN